ncbi:MAG: patatin-like phospholipase family protein [Ahniella sp.]|nr:patatin-like phospholipase family protein [Ahniella sp.]
MDSQTPEFARARKLLDGLPWFQGLPDEARDLLAEGCSWMSLPGGQVLFYEGETADAVYLIAQGSLGAFRRRDGEIQSIGEMFAGESVGELGVLTARPRVATVRALRDSLLLRLPGSHLDMLAERFPQALLGLARLALKRSSEGGARRYDTAPRTIALLPQCAGVPLRDFASELLMRLAKFGRVRLLTSSDADRPPDWFEEQEREARFVLYLADQESGPWRERCRRQADAWLLLARADETPAAFSEVLQPVPHPDAPRPEHLVLLHSAKPRLGAGKRWLKSRPHARLHHVRGEPDVGRIGRLLCHQGLGLVLSGGGARGFAHLGVIKALREAEFEIDAVGGTSMGAVIGAGLAADWSTEEMIEVFRQAFYDTNPLSDWTLPVISLVSGRKQSRLLQDTFGSRDIEDLVLPYFCVSANLTTGAAAVHRTGPLWYWLRASTAIPGIVPPLMHHGEVFVDGGVINNLPVDVMREMHRGEIIAVDIGSDYRLKSKFDESELPPIWQLAAEWFGPSHRPSLRQVLLRAGMVNSGTAALQAREISSLLLTPPLDDIDLTEWKSYFRAIDRGYQYTLRMIGGEKDVLSQEPPTLW